MFSGILIITVTVVLLAFWFRYSCLRLLQGRESAQALTVQQLRKRLEAEGQLDGLRQSLERDYRVVAFVLGHSPALRGSLELHLLLWDYRAMEWWYRITRTTAPRQATHALVEMSSIVAILASQVAPTARVGTQA